MTHHEVEISAELVRELLRDQHPDLAGSPVRLGARGWDNQLWRLGDDLAVRLPWATRDADALLRKEHAWLPGLAPRLPLPVPVPQRLGEPSPRFPRPWIVTTWVPGEPADRAPVTRAAAAADALAAFLSALHRPAPGDAPAGRFGRGAPLAGRSAEFADQLAEATEMGLVPDPDAVRRLGRRRRRARLGRPGALAPRRPASGQRPHRGRHHLRRDRLRRPSHRRSRRPRPPGRQAHLGPTRSRGTTTPDRWPLTDAYCRRSLVAGPAGTAVVRGQVQAERRMKARSSTSIPMERP